MKFILEFNKTSLDPDVNKALHSLYPVSMATWSVLGTYYTLNIVLGLLGNTLVLHALRHPEILLFNKVAMVFMSNLAIADIMGILLQGIPTIGVFIANAWPFGEVVCHFLALVKYTVFYFEVSVVMLLSAHRAYILSYPFRGRLLTKRAAVKTVCVFWIISLLLDIVGVVGSEVTFFDTRFLSCNAGIYLRADISWEGYTLGFFLAVMTLILNISLVIIVKVAHSMRTKMKKNRVTPEADPVPRRQGFKKFLKQNKPVVATLSVAIVFIICGIPVLLIHLLKYLGAHLPPKLALFEEVFVMLSVVANPFIYSLTNPKFLQFYREHLKFTRV